MSKKQIPREWYGFNCDRPGGGWGAHLGATTGCHPVAKAIFRVPYSVSEGEHMFEIDEGERRTSWPRPGDSSWFVVGYHARIEHTQGDKPEVLRIWIGGKE